MTRRANVTPSEIEAALNQAGATIEDVTPSQTSNLHRAIAIMSNITRELDAAARQFGSEFRIAFDVSDKSTVALSGVLILDDGFETKCHPYRCSRYLVGEDSGAQVFLDAPSATRRLVANVARQAAAFLARPT
jgi:hypothetical protein